MMSFTIHLNFLTVFTFHVKSVRDGYQASGTIRNDHKLLPNQAGVWGAAETSEIWHFRGTKWRPKTAVMTGDDHNPQKFNVDFTLYGKIIIKFTSHGKALDHNSREFNF